MEKNTLKVKGWGTRCHGMKWKVLSMLLTLTGLTSQSLLKHTHPEERRMSVQRERERERKRNRVTRGLASSKPEQSIMTKHRKSTFNKIRLSKIIYIGDGY